MRLGPGCLREYLGWRDWCSMLSAQRYSAGYVVLTSKSRHTKTFDRGSRSSAEEIITLEYFVLRPSKPGSYLELPKHPVARRYIVVLRASFGRAGHSVPAVWAANASPTYPGNNLPPGWKTRSRDWKQRCTSIHQILTHTRKYFVTRYLVGSTLQAVVLFHDQHRQSSVMP